MIARGVIRQLLYPTSMEKNNQSLHIHLGIPSRSHPGPDPSHVHLETKRNRIIVLIVRRPEATAIVAAIPTMKIMLSLPPAACAHY